MWSTISQRACSIRCYRPHRDLSAYASAVIQPQVYQISRGGRHGSGLQMSRGVVVQVIHLVQTKFLVRFTKTSVGAVPTMHGTTGLYRKRRFGRTV